jgi:hypothetical protein
VPYTILQAVRKHGSGYYLILHPVNPSSGRPDFLAWLLNQQHDAIIRVATSSNLIVREQSTALDPPPAAATAARRQQNAATFRQMSRDYRNESFRQGSLARGLSAALGPMSPLGGQTSANEPLPPFEEQEDPLEAVAQDKVGPGTCPAAPQHTMRIIPYHTMPTSSRQLLSERQLRSCMLYINYYSLMRLWEVMCGYQPRRHSSPLDQF